MGSGVDIPCLGVKYLVWGVDIPWVGDRYTMDRGVKIPRVEGVNIPWVGGVDIPWIGGQNTMGRGSIYHR